MLYFSFHYYFEDFVEFVGWESFDILSASIEITPDVSEDSEVGVDKEVIHLEDFKVCVAGSQAKLKYAHL